MPLSVTLPFPRLLSLLALVASTVLAVAAETKRPFSVPAGAAETTLKLFSEQSGRGVVFSTDAVKGITTNPVRGELTASEALDRLVARTGLAIRWDEPSASFSVHRAAATPPADPPSPKIPARAESTPAARATTDEAVTLSPFVVATDQDRGYTPGSVTSGSRLALSLRETSAVIGVLTKEFIDDIGATSIDQAAQWGANVYFDGNENNSVATNFLPNAVVRGVPGSSWSLARNYFIAYVPVDTALTERVEIPRGPNAALYGDAPLGGLVNSNSKRAKPQRTFAEIVAITDSNGTVRGSFDTNVSRSERFALRVNAVAEQRRGWRDNDVQHNRSLLLSGTWQPLRRTSVRGEIEFDYNSRTLPPENLTDGVSAWNRTTVINAPLAANPAATTGVTTFSTSGGADYWVLDSGNPSAGLVNWRGFGRTTGKGGALLPDAGAAIALRPDLPNVTRLPSRTFSFNPRSTPFTEKNTKLFAGYIEHTFDSGLALELAYQHVEPRVVKFQGSPYNNYYIDVNTTRPGGGANPHFGEAFTEIDYARSTVRNWVDDARILAAYRVKWRFMEQRLVGMAGQHRDQYNQLLYRLTRVNGTSNLTQNAANLVRVRRYVSELTSVLPAPFDSNGLDVEERAYQLIKQNAYTTYVQAAAAGRYWDGRVSTTLGIRHDDFKQDATTQSPGPGSVTVNDGPRYIWNSADPVRRATPTPYDDYPQKYPKQSITAGATYFPHRSLGVFVNHSQGFNVVGTGPHLDGTPWDPPSNNGYDYGLKLELFDSRLSGTLSRYQSTRTGVDNFGSVAGNFRTIWGLIRDGYNNSGNPTAGTAAQSELDGVNAGAIPSRTTKADGWELDVTANLTRHWRATFNVALPRNQMFDSAAEMRAYYQSHLAAWRTLAATPGFDSTGLTNQFNTIETFIANNADGRTPNGVSDYTARVFTTYRIPTGWLKAFRFGGGLRFDGPRVIGVPQVYQATSATAGAFVTPDPLAVIKSPSSVIATGMIGYDFKLARQPVAVQLNLENLFDNRRIVYTGYTTYTQLNSAGVQKGYQVPSAFRYLTPLSASLRVTVRF